MRNRNKDNEVPVAKTYRSKRDALEFFKNGEEEEEEEEEAARLSIVVSMNRSTIDIKTD